MTARELADRAGVSQPWITQVEQGEVDRSVTLATLDRIARALGCRVEYVLVPERPLDELVREQARRKASALLADVDHTMALEQQRTDQAARQRELDKLTEEFIDRRGLWSGE